ncbi:MAG: phosphoribosylformylglycinamidine cyclo-ligase [Candidatus Aminicenantales bacterium]
MARLTYKKAGVDIDEADEFVRRIRPLLQRTSRPEVLGKPGGFGGLFKPRLQRIKDPVLVSATDGVGTKLLIADLLSKYDTVGVDLVAMCADDVVVTGAEPLFFLDYIACGRLDSRKLYELMKGITRGCRQAGCALIGGETAELPGLYAEDRFDLAGFCVGIVSRKKIIDGRRCRPGDTIIGFASNGLHSNGFSLIRKVFPPDEIKGKLGLKLLRPTRIYTPSILKLMKKAQIKAMAHITGGGFYGNIPRVLPEGMAAEIRKGSWRIPAIFRQIQERGGIDENEMFRTFNMGVGMVAVLSSKDTHQALAFLAKTGQKAWIIGEVVRGKKEVKILD